MSAQETTLAIVKSPPQPEPAPANGERERRPNRGMQREMRRQNAATRLPQLLSEIKGLKHARQQDRIEAESTLKLADEEIELLKKELLAICEERDALKQREEGRLFQIDEERNIALRAADEKRLQVVAALIDISTQTGARKRHVDFDSRVSRMHLFFSTELLVQILRLRNVQVIGELVYLLASNERAAKELAALSLIEQCQHLAPIVTQIEDQFKTAKLKESLGR